MLEDKIEILKPRNDQTMRSTRSSMVLASILAIASAAYVSCGDDSGGGTSECCQEMGCSSGKYSVKHCVDTDSSTEGAYCTTSTYNGKQQCCVCEYD